MAGFIWQLRHLLLYLLEADLDDAVELETHDDIVVSSGNGQIIAAVQTKHSWSAELLTASSVELWKSLRIWTYLLNKGRLSGNTSLVLSTTAQAGPELQPLTKKRKIKSEVEALRQRLDLFASKSENKELISALSEWKKLGRAGREFLIGKLKIQEAQPQLADIDKELEKRLISMAVPTRAVKIFKTQLIGWFEEEVASRLSPEGCKITAGEVISKISELHSMQISAALVTTQDDAKYPALEDERNSDPVYLKQLDLLGATEEHLINAIAMFYRARAERDAWRQTRMNAVSELKSYDRDLQAKWKTIRLDTLRKNPSSTTELVDHGWTIHGRCMDYHGAINGLMAPVHVANGTYYMLANEPESAPCVGWHPDYLRHLSSPKGKK